ncbi:hypothetical protein CA943_03245 [Taylorella equigenitalis]|nr:hypothetical protein B9Z30_03310 [Taylorella equigenitalis]ASY37714.1 hypothetical protein CA605_03235 [Taylorella equigenitalis]ASY40699.1 hypothetical protein CAV20_03235 [Taylorella equigenitalis]ASY42136.1 hypothetical protein CA943_03245 [Taylorella equigenitalis]KGK33286.1 hypothetical protein LW90_06345 [Taylorella equigenitalis]
MKKIDKFNRIWKIIFGIAYIFIMLPFPFFYSTKYNPGWFGVPTFVYGWLIYGTFVILLIALYASKFLKKFGQNDEVSGND